MNYESKPQIRTMVHLIPELVKASFISQAFEIRNIITATFSFSDPFMATLRNVPPNYIEKIASVYKTLMFKSYEAGLAAGKVAEKVLSKKLSGLKGLEIEKQHEGIDKVLRVEYPIPYSLQQDLKSQFGEEVASFLETHVDSAAVYAQFGVDLETAYHDGLKDFVATKELLKPTPELKPEAPVPTANTIEAAVKPVTAMHSEELLEKIEKYTKLLNNPEAERVLRATMGLPPKSEATATAEVETSEAADASEKVGPFDVAKLKEQILAGLKTFPLEPKELQFLCVEKLVDDFPSLTDDQKKELLVQKLMLEDCDPKKCSLQQVMDAADTMAEALSELIGLPGMVLMMEYLGAYCLGFSFETSKARELGLDTGATVKAGLEHKLPPPPCGALPVRKQAEIEALYKFGKSSLSSLSMKEIRKAAPEAHSFLSERLAEAKKHGKLRDMSKICSMSVEELVESCYGTDGSAYLEHVKGKWQ